MIKDNQKMLNRAHVLIDAIIIVLTYLLAYYLRFLSPLTKIPFLRPAKGLSFRSYSFWLIVLVPLYLIVYYCMKLYNPNRTKRKWGELYHIITANLLGIAIFGFILYMAGEGHVARLLLGYFTAFNIILSAAARMLITSVLKRARKKGKSLKHVILVGYSRAAEAYIDRIIANPQWGYYIDGILDDSMEIGTEYKKIRVIGRFEDLEDRLNNSDLDEIAITLSINEYFRLEKIVAECEKSGVHTKFVPDYYNLIPTRPYTEDLYGLPVINIRNVPLSNTANRLIKRLVDIIGAALALIIFAIPMIIVALLILITSGRPVIFSQIRVGRHNKPFKMYKFRSMTLQPDTEEKKAWTTNNDPRVTRIGRFIRRTSIDELPQLFNVLKGDMSLVGPRPERPQFVEMFKEEVPRYMIKHQVPPGLTGWAQINGYRGDTSIRKRIDHDLYYIENWSLGLDFKILFLTIFKGFINKNAY